MSDGQPYLRPAGLLWGRDAEEAVAGGHAGWLAGGPVAFTQIELALRHEALVQRSWHNFADLAASRNEEIVRRLEMISRARAVVAGVCADGPVLMGIINVTPDSFSDGGRTHDHRAAIAQGRALAEAGAAILDVGGESTRPGSDPVSVAEELARVLPVVEALAGEGHTVSIDTRKAEVMRQAAAVGAKIVNDVSALTYDNASAAVVRELKLPTILMHAQGDPKTMQRNPSYDDVALDVFDALEGWIETQHTAGFNRSCLLADPGIGFGKTFKHNLEIISRLTLFHGLGVNLVFGASRKAFIGALTGERTAGKRVSGSIGVAINAAMQGAQVIRVHDVRETREALQVWRAGVNATATTA
jgi:dihydropteroate synthase